MQVLTGSGLRIIFLPWIYQKCSGCWAGRNSRSLSRTDIKNENLAKEITHGSTKQIVECERNFLMALEGNCETP